MEAPGFVTLLYIMYSLPKQEGIERLPFPNYIMAAMFVRHYHYKAYIKDLKSADIVLFARPSITFTGPY